MSRKPPKTEDLPWDPERLSGIDVSKNKSMAAAYLGYSDIGEFRTYQCSHSSLDVWFKWDLVKPPHIRGDALFKILDATRDNLERKFGGPFESPHERYPTSKHVAGEDTSQTYARNEKLAALLYQLVHNQQPFSLERQNALIREHFESRTDQRTLALGIDLRMDWV